MPASPSLNMVWSSASKTLIGPLALRFSPITPRSGQSVRPESIVASTPCRATDVRPFLSLFTEVRGRGILRTSCVRSSKKFDRGRFLEVGLSYPRGRLLYPPVGRMLHRRLTLLEVLRDLLKSPGLILEGLHLVLVALVVGVAAAFEQQGVDRPGGLVRLPVAILIVGGDRDALSQALGPQILDHVLVGVPNGGQVRLRGHEVDAVLEVGQLGYVVAAGAL